jgi:hypothetical protein
MGRRTWGQPPGEYVHDAAGAGAACSASRALARLLQSSSSTSCISCRPMWHMQPVQRQGGGPVSCLRAAMHAQAQDTCMRTHPAGTSTPQCHLSYVLRCFYALCRYPCIVGAGRNGAILHYERNTAVVGPQDLVLVDAGERAGASSQSPPLPASPAPFASSVLPDHGCGLEAPSEQARPSWG